MFYSHEVLTSRQYGVATIWLVATLGSRSTLRKVNRKAILEVNVPKACETIISPEAPMALRLQSNLLYGVARVHNEQCTYVLVDAQEAQNKMRTLLRTVTVVELEGKHTAKADQLILREDTRFMLEDLVNFDLDLSHGLDTSSGTSSLDSLLFPHRSISSAFGSEHDDPSIGGIVIPPSVSSSGGPGGFSIGGGAYNVSNRGSRFGSSQFRREEDTKLIDPGFEWNEELGDFIDSTGHDVPDADAQPELPTLRDPTVLDDDVMDFNVRNPVDDMHYRDEEDVLPPLGDDHDINADVEAFPTRPHQSSLPPRSQTHNSSRSAEPTELASDDTTVEETATAPAIRVRKRKAIGLDQEQELLNQDLSGWSDNYLAQMEQDTNGKAQTRSNALAKKNANFWVFQNGVGGLGTTFGQEAIPEPLRMFTGNALLQALTGLRITVSGEKHSREEDGEEAEADASDDGRRVRSRSGEGEMGRGDDDLIINEPSYVSDMGDDFGDGGNRDETIEQTVEVGREAQTPLAEHMSSIMPWNNTGSIRGSSARHGSRPPLSVGGYATSSAGGGVIGRLGGMNSRIGSRMVSASPLRGRGEVSASLGPLYDYPQPAVGLGHDQDGGSDGSPEHDNQHAETSLDLNEQFEIFGPAANVQTQRADQPTWLHQALDSESINFLSFVQTSIQDADNVREAIPAHAGAEAAREGEDTRNGRILFETLLPSARNSRIVAAQGLLHVLTLATRKMLHADQDTAFGPISMRVTELTGPRVPTAAVTVTET